MSGNPFRRSQASRLPDEITHHDGPRASSPAPPQSKKKKKRVVIQTPPHSPEESSIPRRYSDGTTGSPPPPARKGDDGDEVKSTSTDDFGVDQALFNTRQNSGSLPPPPITSFGGQTGGRAPYNPFARTLATSEAAFGLQQRNEEQTGRGGETSQARQGGSRPALDVDTFTQILMTGSAVPSTHVPPASQKQQDNSSSNTDTSSISMHSVFDPAHEAHAESPRTSLDDHHSGSEDEAGDEHSSLMGPIASRPVEEGPPRPPKHTHGRPIPQTVSWADFDNTTPSVNAPAAPNTPPPNTQLLHGHIGSPTLTPRSPRDLNKPLPPPPAEKRSAESPTRITSGQEIVPPQHLTAAEQQTQPKKPPPPPTSRRQGQSTTSQGRARSTSNISQASSLTDADIRLPTSDQSLKPPPPPSRRSQPVQTPSDFGSPHLRAVAESKTMPPPPPRRQSSKSGTSVSRTPSNASHTSFSRSDASPVPPSNSAVPPAPPPRRGGALRNSMEGPPNSLSKRRPSTDYRRMSGQSFDSDRSVSLSSLKQVAEPGEADEVALSPAVGERPQRDILADMSALQAEIDALRSQGGRSG